MEETETKETNSSIIYYVVGGVVVALLVAGYFLRPKASPLPASPVSGVPVNESTTPASGPITKLACEKQYYNPVIGFPRYFLSAEGADVSSAKDVTCEFTVTVGGKVVSTATASSKLTESPTRGGSTFRCTTGEIALEPTVPTVVGVTVKDDLKASTNCSATFLLPKP